METSIIAELATQFGAPGLIIGYLVWDRLQIRKDRQGEEEKRLVFDQARLEADRKLAESLGSLASLIQARLT